MTPKHSFPPLKIRKCQIQTVWPMWTCFSVLNLAHWLISILIGHWPVLFHSPKSPGISWTGLKKEQRRGWKGWGIFSVFFCCRSLTPSFYRSLHIRVKYQRHLITNNKGFKSSRSFASEGLNNKHPFQQLEYSKLSSSSAPPSSVTLRVPEIRLWQNDQLFGVLFHNVPYRFSFFVKM